MTDQEIDAALERVLRASGTSLRNYSVQKNIQDMRDVMRELLTPVQSGGVMTREVIGQLDINKAFTAHLRNWGRNYPTDPTIVVTYDELSAGLMAVHALQLPAPTPQPEAWGMDLSTIIEQVFIDHKAPHDYELILKIAKRLAEVMSGMHG